jgi:hypothetical protein
MGPRQAATGPASKERTMTTLRTRPPLPVALWRAIAESLHARHRPRRAPAATTGCPSERQLRELARALPVALRQDLGLPATPRGAGGSVPEQDLLRQRW